MTTDGPNYANGHEVDSTADSFDVLAYLAGGLLAWGWWSWRRRVAATH